MKYVIDVPEEMITSSGELLFHYKNTKDLTYQMYTGINVIPYTEPDEIKNNKVNLCSSCELYKEHFPECGDVNVLFGDGVINDNICCCSGYVAKNENKIRQKVEDEVWDFARRIICPSDCCEDSISKYTEKFLGIPSHKARAIFKDLSYQEAKAKYEEWKKHKDEIRVGDEVVYHGDKYVVGYVGADEVYHIVDRNWIRVVVQGDYQIFKTGRHFDEVEALLKKMREE